MSVLAFCVLAVLVIGYVLLDGYDLGMAGILLFVARNGEERRAARETIAPFWNGNEVFLVAAGAALFAFFPLAYASAFSGFYLPFMVVLWLLMGRGIAFEIREMIEHPLWHAFWDTAFSLSSLTLIVFFGVALGNIVRGVPLQAGGYFLGLFAFMFNGYALAVALLAVLALALHGAAYVLARTEGALAERCRAVVARIWPIIAIWWIAVSAATFFVRPASTFGVPIAIGIGALIAACSLVAVRLTLTWTQYERTFVASSTFLGSLLLAAVATIFPDLLPGFPDPKAGLDIYRAAPSQAATVTTLVVTILGLVLLAGYRTFLARRFDNARAARARDDDRLIQDVGRAR